MRVPTRSQLTAGALVNIVLKVDQRTGRLTPGAIADFLTKGDHPRGVKVRLSNGQIGRVQSLQLSSDPVSSFPDSAQKSVSMSPRPSSLRTPSTVSQPSFLPQNMQYPSSRTARFHLQEDFRSDPVPAESRSLEDYIKRPTQKKKGRKGNALGITANSATPASQTNQENEQRKTEAVGMAVQHQLEQDFPRIDSALIAAILADHAGNAEAVRKTLHEIGSGSR